MVGIVFHKLPVTAYLFFPFMQAFIGPFIFCFGCFYSRHFSSNLLGLFHRNLLISIFYFPTCPLQTD